MKRYLPTVSFFRGVCGVVCLLMVWEGFARSGMFSTSMTPTLGTIAKIFIGMLADGSMAENAAATLLRVAVGMAIAFVIAMFIGVAMGRSAIAERIFLPVISVILPIPSLAWVPLFILWFGIGDLSTILVVIYAATFPMVYSVWTGVRTINRIWLRSARVMGASETATIWKIIIPASLPYIITGVRLGFGRAWIGVIGGELLASPKYGLGQIIFNAREFLDTGVMLATLVVIGIIGIFFERLVFQKLESVTIKRWGMTVG